MGHVSSRINRLAMTGLVVVTIAAATLSPTSAAPAQAGLFDDRGTTSTTAKNKKKSSPFGDLCEQLDDAASQVTDLLDAVGGGGGGFDLGDLLDTGKILKGLK